MGEVPSGKPPIYPRTWVIRVRCPACGAAAGERCRGVSGPRVSNHLERVWRYHNRARDQGSRDQ